MSADFPGHRPEDLPGGVPGAVPGDVRGAVPGGVPGALPGDLLGDIMSTEPGLGALLGLMTADATPGELAGESAALAMFRANRRRSVPPPNLAEAGQAAVCFDAAGRVAPGDRGSRRRAPRARRVGLMAAAVTLAAAAGFAVAAYTETLPAPLQQAAYHALGFAGVPAAHHTAPGAASSPAPGNARGHARPHKPGHAAPPASPVPSIAGPAPAAGQVRLSIAVAAVRIVGGNGDTFTGQLSDHAGGVAGASLSLLEREPGQTGWDVAGTATTSSNGSATITASGLTVNAAFRLKGPDGALSRPVLVTVMPPVSAAVGGSSLMTGTITASSPLAAPGDGVVLQILSGAHWMNLHVATLNGASQAQFTVRSRARQRTYRVVLLPTASHGLSVSNAVTFPHAPGLARRR